MNRKQISLKEMYPELKKTINVKEEWKNDRRELVKKYYKESEVEKILNIWFNIEYKGF